MEFSKIFRFLGCNEDVNIISNFDFIIFLFYFCFGYVIENGYCKW